MSTTEAHPSAREPRPAAAREGVPREGPVPRPEEVEGAATQAQPDVTIVVPVQTEKAEVRRVVRALGEELERLGRTWECILVYDGVKGERWEEGLALQAASAQQVRTIALHKPFGETVCLASAFDHARGDLVLTAPQYVQVDPRSLGRLFEALADGADLVATWRHPRIDSRVNRVQSWAFNWAMRTVVGAHFHDLNSTLRLMRREVLEQLTIYGNMYRYLPAIAYRHGFRVDEVQVRHIAEWGGSGVFGPGVYLRRALDLLGLTFLTRFTHKPLRFFGAVGGLMMLVGVLLAGSQVLRWAMAEGAFGLYQRPFFLIGVLLVVLGAQVIGFGLVGEIIIYTQARNVREYRIERVYE